VQVKSGCVGVNHVRDLKGVLEREKAAIGAPTTLREPTRRMLTDAAAAGSGRKTQALRQKGCSARARLKARANRAKSGSANFSRRLSRRTAIKKYRSERKARRSFDTAIEYGGVAIMATGEARTAKPAVRTTCFLYHAQGQRRPAPRACPCCQSSALLAPSVAPVQWGSPEGGETAIGRGRFA
jgi:hypothetical protein